MRWRPAGGTKLRRIVIGVGLAALALVVIWAGLKINSAGRAGYDGKQALESAEAAIAEGDVDAADAALDEAEEAFSRARSSSCGVKSRAVTDAPARLAVIAATPVPQQTSRTRSPARTRAWRMRRAAGGVVITSSGTKCAQPCFCASLNCASASIRNSMFAAEEGVSYLTDVPRIDIAAACLVVQFLVGGD